MMGYPTVPIESHTNDAIIIGLEVIIVLMRKRSSSCSRVHFPKLPELSQVTSALIREVSTTRILGGTQFFARK